MEIKLPSGATMSGTQEEVTNTLRNLGINLLDVAPPGTYWSESKGEFVVITEMHTNYLVNAALKLYRKWVADLSDADHLGLLSALRRGPDTRVFGELITELTKRMVDSYGTARVEEALRGD